MRLSSAFARTGLIAAAALPLGACSTLGYYGHLAHGEVSLLAARRPVEKILSDPAADVQLKARLQSAQAARQFATETLKLPRNRSYTSYADLQRQYATWNVFAASEFSVEPVHYCFLIVGCLAYRGYFEKDKAENAAAKLRAQGYETWIGGSSAYSTLGWFADPILDTMLRNDDDALAATIFHELAHQQLYLKGDTQFNESFATFVQREGLRQWRSARDLGARDDSAQARDHQFTQLALALRERLSALYARGLAPALTHERKREEIEQFRREYFHLRDSQWAGQGDYDDWVTSEINNAKLAPLGIYDGLVPAFAALYKKENRDWTKFYTAVRALAHMDTAARTRELQGLMPASH
jgi:predicted aminopeptidase